MLKPFVAAALAWACAFSAGSGQERVKIDFRRDLQPLFKTHCLDCHGPKQQKNGFRLEHPQR